MTLRPIPARWFELVTVHSDLAKAMESLSRTGAVELEARRGPTERLPLSGLDEQVRGIQERMARYKAYCPAAASEGVRRSERLAEMLDRAHRHVAAWSEQADPIVASLERRSREAADLEQLREALTHAGAELPDLRRLARAGPRLQARLLMLPAGKMLYGLSAPLLLHHWRSPSADYLLAVGRPVAIGELETQLPAGGRVVPLPPWLPSSVAESLSNISKRLVDLAKEKETLNGECRAALNCANPSLLFFNMLMKMVIALNLRNCS
jgi:V/A-type H+-transporting ATPase subunit I